jgi:hypothetical protein
MDRKFVPPLTSIDAPTIFSVDDITIVLAFLIAPEGANALILHMAERRRTAWSIIFKILC